jgi:hypothetical protein
VMHFFNLQQPWKLTWPPLPERGTDRSGPTSTGHMTQPWGPRLKPRHSLMPNDTTR